jgi:hypothetical protein
MRRTARRFRGERRERKLFFKSYELFGPAVFLILQEPIHCAEYESHGGEGGDGGGRRHTRIENDKLSAHCQQGDQDNGANLDDAVTPDRGFDDRMLEFHGDQHRKDGSEQSLKDFVIKWI